jgi:catechol 2,3-dioxygenase-like lactoylglutathione lyase family enzyme
MAHVGHAELLTPRPEASLEYFTALLGLTVATEQDGSWYLPGYGDYEPYCLTLTAVGAPEESVTSEWPAPALHIRRPLFAQPAAMIVAFAQQATMITTDMPGMSHRRVSEGE